MRKSIEASIVVHRGNKGAIGTFRDKGSDEHRAGPSLTMSVTTTRHGYISGRKIEVCPIRVMRH